MAPTEPLLQQADVGSVGGSIFQSVWTWRDESSTTGSPSALRIGVVFNGGVPPYSKVSPECIKSADVISVGKTQMTMSGSRFHNNWSIGPLESHHGTLWAERARIGLAVACCLK